MTVVTQSREELKALYGAEYVQKFKTQSPRRLGRLLPYLRLRPTDIVADFGCGNGMLLDLVGDRVRPAHLLQRRGDGTLLIPAHTSRR